MSVALFDCPVCTQPLDPSLGNSGKFRDCPRCGTGLRIDIFPVQQRDLMAERQPEALQNEGEAACYFHAANRARTACVKCGRFICNLCTLTAGGQLYCPACIAAAVSDTRVVIGEREFVRYDQLALVVGLHALTPLLGFVFAPLTFFLIWLDVRQSRPKIGGHLPTLILAGLLATFGSFAIFALILGLASI